MLFEFIGNVHTVLRSLHEMQSNFFYLRASLKQLIISVRRYLAILQVKIY